ncbi:hypothetical protein KC19_2G011500 [Ceratodon purpureus]|uniref:Uncharacterized protein n=1 Tax=Ceratodon purpureus TaxID=3225 RepID=A0A8T0IRZ7_CERPU|nr:hypothetical protein KC19_2G011500 [Ceratodon purpureus]
MEKRRPDGGGANGDDGAMRWWSEISLQPDWLGECGFVDLTPELCYMAEDGEGDILGAASRPGLLLFGSEAVRNPSSGSKNDAEMRKTCADVIFYTGGSVWALDWCPRRSGWFSQNVRSEFLVVGAHPKQSPHHRLGEPLRGKGLLQIWAINLMPEKSSSVKANNGDLGRGMHKGQGRGPNRVRGQESRAASDDFSDDESNMSSSPVDTYTRGTGFNLTRGGREKARGRGRGRGRGKTHLMSEAEASDDENDVTTPGSPPETSNAWIKGRARASRTGGSREVEPSPSARKMPLSKSSVVLPKMVLGIAHEGEVTWDAKWRPVAVAGGASECTEGLDERECMRLGFLAVVLGDGSVQVFDVPLPTTREENGTMGGETEPLIVQMNPIFRSSDLQSNGHKSIPLSVEWSTWAPHDMLLVGCHDGTVAVFKVFPCSAPLQESRPLLFFTADFMTLRTVAWAPANCSGSAGKHLIATAGHSGWIRFWDLRDPYQPVYELQISRGVVTSIDWVSDPRCMLITMDDGSVRVLALDKAATDTAVTGKPYTGTPTQGLASYYASYYAMWGVHVSRFSGLVAYCGTDGNVLQFQLTEKALIKEGSRYRQPHFLCGVFAADAESGPMYIISQNLVPPSRAQKTVTNLPTPQFRRDFLTRRNSVLKSSGVGAGFIPSGNPLDMEKPGNKKKKAEEKPSGKSKKSKKSDTGDDAGEEPAEDSEAGDFQNPSDNVQNLPVRVVAVQRLRWNCNSGREKWLAYGGAAGIIRCQYVLSKQ